MFHLSFITNNAAFMNPQSGEEDEIYEAQETERILNKLIRQISHDGLRSGSIIDINGNKIGEWRFR